MFRKALTEQEIKRIVNKEINEKKKRDDMVAMRNDAVNAITAMLPKPRKIKIWMYDTSPREGYAYIAFFVEGSVTQQSKSFDLGNPQQILDAILFVLRLKETPKIKK